MKLVYPLLAFALFSVLIEPKDKENITSKSTPLLKQKKLKKITPFPNHPIKTAKFQKYQTQKTKTQTSNNLKPILRT